MKPTPKVYAKRPPCKWHGYDCHRDVPEGDTLCPYHRTDARNARIENAVNSPRYKGSEPRVRFQGGLLDPGCDCSVCLGRLP